MQQISFMVDGQKLNGNLFYPENPKEKNPAILFIHGWTSEMKRSYEYAEALSELGYICMLFDMRGHGISEGNIDEQTRQDFINDILAAYDYLIKCEKVDEENVSAVGSSFGGYLVALLSSKRNLRNIVLRVPANYPDEGLNEKQILFSGDNNPEILRFRFLAMDKTRTFSLNALSEFSGNILIIESEKDNLVPHQTVENYVNAAKDKSKLRHILMKDAPHSIKEGRFKNEVKQILIDWFKDKI